MSSNNIKIGSNRSFGIVFFAFFLIIAFYPLLKGNDLRVWSIILSLIFLVLGLMNSVILSPLNKLWFKFGLMIGRVVSPIVMGIIFFFVVTPTGILMRLTGKDLLKLKFNNTNTYWIEKSDPKSKMTNQF